ncbi:MAG: hypothetical protein ACHQF0_12805 [Chitinophagales bacterium]
MKCLLVAAIFFAASCTKDPIKNQCRQVYDTKEIWNDSARGYIRTDTTWSSKSVICGEELQHLSTQPDSWVRICNPDGSAHYWEHWVMVFR